MSEESEALNRLAREQMKVRLLADIAVDMRVCELEGWDYMEYASELLDEVQRIVVRFAPKGSELPRYDHVCANCGAPIGIFTKSCPECGAVFDMGRAFARYEAY